MCDSDNRGVLREKSRGIFLNINNIIVYNKRTNSTTYHESNSMMDNIDFSKYLINGYLPCGIDDGHSEIKVVLPGNVKFTFPSLAKAGEAKFVSLGGKTQNVHEYSTDDGPYVIGPIDKADPTSFLQYPTSALNRVLVTHALRLSNIPSHIRLRIGSGLPIRRYYKGKEINKPLIKGKIANLAREDVFGKDGYRPPKIAKHDVISEAVGAWMDYVIENNDGKFLVNTDKVEEKTAIVDIGGETTDIAVIKDWDLDWDKASTIDNLGMINIKQSVRDAVYTEFEVDINQQQLDKALETNKINLWNNDYDIGEIIEGNIKNVANSICTEIQSRLKAGADIRNVLFVGGTVSKIGKYLEGLYPQQRIVPNPQYCNAMGFYKYASISLASSSHK